MKPKLTVSHVHTFSRAWRQLHVMTSSFDWFIGLSVPFVIRLSDLLWFWFYDTTRKPLHCKAIEMNYYMYQDWNDTYKIIVT